MLRHATFSRGSTFMALYIVIERFKNGDPLPVYRRLRDRGRQMPDGVSYVGSWVVEDFTRCYQVMRAESAARLDEWIAGWSDLVDFEVHRVVESTEAAARVADRLSLE